MSEASFVVLATDFGPESVFVGVMKGVLAAINPDCRVIDLFHDCPPGDVSGAGLRLKSAYSFFPRGAIFVVVVDPGVGTDRGILVARTEAYTFLGPDNGVFSFLRQDVPDAVFFRVNNPEFFRHGCCDTFHGRDRFAPLAGHLSLGLPIDAAAEPCGAIVAVDLDPIVDGRRIVGRIVWIDRFGNLVTNISPKDFLRRTPSFMIGGTRIDGIARTFAEISNGVGAVVGSADTVEFAVNGGSCADVLGARIGQEVVVELEG